MTATAATIDEFMALAWDEHTADPAGVAARIGGARPLIEQSPNKVGDFLWLAEHVLLGHLGDAGALEPWFAVLAPLVERHPDARPALDRARLAARLLRGGSVPADASRALVIRAHGTAAMGETARGDMARARALFQSAIAVARDAGIEDTDSIKALAACCNNLATLLLDGPREPAADALMMEAAELSRRTWGEVGTWMNAERGDYVLALCAAAVGDGAKAVGHAKDCLAICEANDADAFERFFGHEALGRGLLASRDSAGARGQLAAMQALRAAIGEDNRAYAQSTLDKLARDIAA